MKISKTVIFLIGFAFLGVATLAMAKIKEASELIRLPEVEILDADLHEFSINDYFKLNVDKVALEREGGIDNLRFRVFAGSIKELSNTDFREKDKYKCILYSSRSYIPEEYNGGLRFSFAFGYNWLGINESNELKSQTYVIVFEEQNDSDDILRLHPDQVEAYFSQGYQFVVRKPRTLDKETELVIVNSKKKKIVRVRENLTGRANSDLQTIECDMLLAASLLKHWKLANLCVSREGAFKT